MQLRTLRQADKLLSTIVTSHLSPNGSLIHAEEVPTGRLEPVPLAPLRPLGHVDAVERVRVAGGGRRVRGGAMPHQAVDEHQGAWKGEEESPSETLSI